MPRSGKRSKTRNHDLKRCFLVWVIVLSVITAAAGMVMAKSVYVLADHENASAPIQTYEIQGDQVAYEDTDNTYIGRALGIAVENDTKTLFVTVEAEGRIYLVDGVTFANLGQVSAPDATNLAGIVVDQEKQKVYVIERTTNRLWAYFWNAGTKTLTLDGGTYKTLEYEGIFGVALDEAEDLLYVTKNDTTIHYYDTGTWSWQGSFEVSEDMVSVAVDSANGLVYTGGTFAKGEVEGEILSQYDVGSGTETTMDIGVGVVGLAVDQETGLLYITTANNDLRVYDCSSWPWQMTDQTDEMENPVGVCVSGTICGNPLSLSKYDRGGCVWPGEMITYDICYDNNLNECPVEGVTIFDTLPNEVDFVYASRGGTYDDCTRTVTWDLGTLEGDQGGCVQLTVQVKEEISYWSTIVNQSTIQGDDVESTTDYEYTQVCGYSNLYINKYDNTGDCLWPGDTITYQICYANYYNSRGVDGIVITDTLPTQVDFVSATGCYTYNDCTRTVTWDLGSLGPGEYGGCVELVVQVEESTSLGTWIYNSCNIDSDQTSYSSAYEYSWVCSLVLNLSKDDGLSEDDCIWPGDTITYEICYDNLDNHLPVDNVIISDTLPTEVDFVSATGDYTYEGWTRTITWDIGSLEAYDEGGCVELVVSTRPFDTPGRTIYNSCTIDGDDVSPTVVSESTEVCECLGIVYPNPFQPNDQDDNTGTWNTGVIFKCLPDGSMITIYNLTGELIQDSGAIDGGQWAWSGCNATGEKVASGMYMYRLIYAGQEHIGKIIVVK